MIVDTYQTTIKSMVDVLNPVSSCLEYDSTHLYLEHDAVGIWRCDVSTRAADNKSIGRGQWSSLCQGRPEESHDYSDR